MRREQVRRALVWSVYAVTVVAAIVATASQSSDSDGPVLSDKKLAAEHRRQTKRVYTLLYDIVRIAIFTFLSAIFAGLTLGVMCADTFTLEIIATSGPVPECKYAAKVLPLRREGHKTLCTLIISNMLLNTLIVQEFAKVFDVLNAIKNRGLPHEETTKDRSDLYGFLISTFVIVVFAEVIPMSICKSKYSLRVAAAGSPFVRIAMFLTYPVSAPLGWMLDKIVGTEEAGQIFDRKELRKLMCIHYEQEGKEVMEQTELTLMLAAMDFQDRRVGEIMTPIKNVTMVDDDDLVTADFIEKLWLSGRSRVPVRSATGQIYDVLVVKDLMMFADAQSYKEGGERSAPLSVKEVVKTKSRPFAMVGYSTKLPVMLKFFQNAKTHMAIVYADDGDGTEDSPELETTQSASAVARKRTTPDSAPVGLVTMEDVVEELLGDEIYDEYDRYESTETSPAASPVRPKEFRTPQGGSLALPSEPRTPPRVSFYSFFTHPERTVPLTDSQVWAVVYFLNRTVPPFFAWSPPYIKLLLDEIGDEQLVPAEEATQSEGVTSEHSVGTAPLSPGVDFDTISIGTFDGERRGTRYASFLQGDHTKFLNMAQEERFVLYSSGVHSDVFTLVLGGRVDLLVGQDNFYSKAYSFHWLGEKALTEPFYVPEFSAIVRKPARVLRIKRALFEKYLSYQSLTQESTSRVRIVGSRNAQRGDRYRSRSTSNRGSFREGQQDALLSGQSRGYGTLQ